MQVPKTFFKEKKLQIVIIFFFIFVDFYHIRRRHALLYIFISSKRVTNYNTVRYSITERKKHKSL